MRLAMNYGGDYVILTPASFSGVTAGGVAAQAPLGTVYASITLRGANAGLTINGDTYTLIHSKSDLPGVSGTGKYGLAQNWDASGTTYTTLVVATLDGIFAGLGNTTDNLKIASPPISTSVCLERRQPAASFGISG
jgi:hypothetical protein